MPIRTAFLATLVLAFAVAAPAQTLRVLVTNDDGIAAPGIDALVNKLATNPKLDVHLIAPATNQSGSGDAYTTTGPLLVTPAATASAVSGLAVAGKPADTTLFGIRQQLSADPPDLVVSGVNFGQNISELADLSGTVGAAYWAARLGVPGIAISASLRSPDYAAAADFVAKVVEKFRRTPGFRKKMFEKDAPHRGMVLNVNYPTCTTGTTVRGARVVAQGRITRITSYTDLGGGSWQPIATSAPFADSNCTSTADKLATDIEAWNNGFVTITPLAPDRNTAGWRLGDYRFLEKLL